MNTHTYPLKDEWGWGISAIAELSIISSDYPDTGTLEAYPDGHWDFCCVHPEGEGTFGTYTTFGDVGAIVDVLDGIANQINIEGQNRHRGYASSSSVVQDVLSMPFELTTGKEIQVYQVPRIPAELDGDGVPVELKEMKKAEESGSTGEPGSSGEPGATGEPGEPGESPDPEQNIYHLTEFRWGERSIEDEVTEEASTEWIDITDDVDVSVAGDTIRVTGYDYELNAVTDYDKDTAKIDAAEGAEKYEPGDYGYKLVVIIPINAKATFGGNVIQTNNPDRSGFIPSIPQKEKDEEFPEELVKWEDNTVYNPEGDPFVDMYPVPSVDLKVNYKIVSDSMYIYAPQKALLHNLVTDKDNGLFYVDPGYYDAKTAVKNALDFYEASKGDPEEEKALERYNEAKKNFASYKSYIPDGINNQFVNIKYELKDPESSVIGTMEIPHGRAYTGGNIKWKFVDGTGKEVENPIITKSGEYTITATITPAQTERADGGYIWTVLNSEAEKDAITGKAAADESALEGIDENNTFSENKSSTGSKSEGSGKETNVTEHPEAYLFQLQISTSDTRLTPGSAVDFPISGEPLKTTENPHIEGYEWVCTDKRTKSEKKNEPGENGLVSVGSGVTVVSQVPDKAVTEHLAGDVSGTMTVLAEDGEYVPVEAALIRNIGSLDKGAEFEPEDLLATGHKPTYMTDSDNVWGEGISSVIWIHDCGIFEECDGEDAGHDFYDAQEKYNTDDGSAGDGEVQYLIHVLDNPLPEITKETSTPQITLGSDIHWKVDASNDNEEKNPKHRFSEFSLVDVMPYADDGRTDPNTNNVGSEFSGTLMFKSVTADYSKAPTALEKLKTGNGAMYYTNDESVRNASEMETLGKSIDHNISWIKAEQKVDGSTVKFTVPESAAAIKLDALLNWSESVSLEITANLKEPSLQNPSDRYHNVAFVLNGKGKKDSNVVATTVEPLYISGTVWEDTDANGLIDKEDTELPGILVTLYAPYDGRNGGEPDRTIGGIKLSRVYNTEGDKIPPIPTDADGGYLFDGLSSGTYYVVADEIPECYSITKKQAGKDNPGTAAADSEAEEQFAETTEDKGDSVWIKDIVLTASGAENENIGLLLIKGSVQVYKALDEIYYPSTMTEEDKADYRVSFLFQLKNAGTGAVYNNAVYLDEGTLLGGGGEPVASCTFTDLPLGTYKLTEMSETSCSISNVTGPANSVKYNPETKETEIKITAEEHDIQVQVENKLDRDPPGGDENGLANHVNMRVPIKLELFYAGPDAIKDSTLTEYTFKSGDFSDIVVTYDDGTTASLKDGTLKFEQVTLGPETVANTMNTGDGKITVSGYYTEKGRVVMDSFQVGVELKQIHKFYLNFNANGSYFDNGQTTNSVRFGFDEISASNYVIKGTYKDADNEGLEDLEGFTFAGWNTKPDGKGVQYDGLSALGAVGTSTDVTSLTLYANWKTKITFDTNGGSLVGGATDEERAIVGREQDSITANKNQVIATTLTATKTDYSFVLWNTKPDGTGTNLEDYGKVTGPVTFYAVYYQTHYPYTGGEQVFHVPFDGLYSITVAGAIGGGDTTAHSGGSHPGYGGKASGTIWLKANTTLYVYVGGAGTSEGYNGGGYCSRFPRYSGGGATDVRYAGNGNWEDNLTTRIIVAGGGGGADNGGAAAGAVGQFDDGTGGDGGGLSGGYGTVNGSPRFAPGTQTSGYAIGYGGNGTQDDAGGGGGYYGGIGSNSNVGGGAGGSGYVSGMTGCAQAVGGYVFEDASMQTGVNGSNGYADIVLLGRTD